MMRHYCKLTNRSNQISNNCKNTQIKTLEKDKEELEKSQREIEKEKEELYKQVSKL